MVILLTSKYRQAAKFTDTARLSTLLATFPKRSLAWGSAIGWKDPANQDGGRRQYSWSITNERPEAGPEDRPADLKRHSNLANPEPVHLIVFRKGPVPQPTPQALRELSYITMGSGVAAGFKHGSPVWYGSKQRPYELRMRDLQCHEAEYDPTRPLAHCCWQRPNNLAQALLSVNAVRPGLFSATAQAAEDLWHMATNGTDIDNSDSSKRECIPVPDGVVPTALGAFLLGIGCPASELTASTSRIIAAPCVVLKIIVE